MPQRLIIEPGRHCGEYVRRARSGRRMLVPPAGCLCGLFPRGAARLFRQRRRRFRVFRAWPALRGVRSTAAAVRHVGVPGPACLTPPIFEVFRLACSYRPNHIPALTGNYLELIFKRIVTHAAKINRQRTRNHGGKPTVLPYCLEEYPWPNWTSAKSGS